MTRLMVSILMLGLWTGAATAQDNRSISKVAGDVYRFQNNYHVNVFVVTNDGVVVTDPINADAAAWLKSEIAKITRQPITHLIYSHSHGDHASGGKSYGNPSTIIAQKNSPASIDGVRPTQRFDDEMEFKFGGKTFELTYLGPGHGNDLSVLIIRPENIAFIVDAVSSKRLFYRDFPNANVDDWINQVKKIQSLDFERFVGGHGPVGNKKDVRDGLAYLKELRAAVLEGLKAGHSVDKLGRTIKMEKYKDWLNYDQWLKLNIAGMARHLIQSGDFSDEGIEDSEDDEDDKVRSKKSKRESDAMGDEGEEQDDDDDDDKKRDKKGKKESDAMGDEGEEQEDDKS